MASETRAIDVQAFYAVPFYVPPNLTILSSDELKSALTPSNAGLKRSESLKTAASLGKKRPSLASLKTFSSKSSVTLGKANNPVASASVPPASPTPEDSPPAQQSSDTKSDEGCSDSSTNTKSEAQQKKKKWVLFTKSHKKDKVPDVKENGHASAPSPPISTSDTNDASPSGANESHSPQLHEQQCVGSNSSTPKVPSRPNTPKALNTEALKRPDLEQLHLALSDLGKVNTFFAPGPDPVLTPSTGRSTYGPRTPRTPGGTIIPNHLFTPGHLVDREVYLEQLYRKRVTAIDDDASWWDDFKKRPLSLVPELAEGMGDDDSETIAASTVGIVSVDDAIAMDLASIEALNLGGLVPHDPNGDYIFFTVDADWDPQSGEDATCFLVDHPFEVPPSSVAMSYADEFDRGACHLVVETTSIHKPNPIDEMTDEELDMCHELVQEIGLAI